jgi:hypothetical protein
MSAGVSASEFDGLQYDLGYTEIQGEIDLYFDIYGEVTDLQLQFNVEQNLPSTAIPEYIDGICDESSPEYNEEVCQALSRVFSPEVLAWLDIQWNQHLATALGVLPQAVETRQLPWPIDYFGSLYLMDYQLDWPCTWEPSQGSFINVPLSYAFDTPLGEAMTITTSFALAGEGQVQRNNDYALNGTIDFDSGLVFSGNDIYLDIQFGVNAMYEGLN